MPKSALIFGGGPMGIMLAEYLSYLNCEEISVAEPQAQRAKFIMLLVQVLVPLFAFAVFFYKVM